ncbi:hypothetical protein BBO99_00002230 [Phytophthora kernoviae]|nr:hypothetical protein BBO99_00002230 [Phytophthora kernoviae]
MFSKTICALCVVAVAFSSLAVDASSEAAQTFGLIHKNAGGYGYGYGHGHGHGNGHGVGVGMGVNTGGYACLRVCSSARLLVCHGPEYEPADWQSFVFSDSVDAYQ